MLQEAFFLDHPTGQERLLSLVFTVFLAPIQDLVCCRLYFKMSVELNGPGCLHIVKI